MIPGPAARRRAQLARLVLASLLVPGLAAGGPPRFVTETQPYLIGQAPDWLDRRHVVWHDPIVRDEDGDGQFNIYRSTLDGAEKVCLTCGLEGRHQVAVVQPRGKWILFHSWNGHTLTVGAPGFGGLGSDVWVMTRDGQQRTNLTRSAELYDHFHAYWSPDGRYVVWTALNWNEAEGGNGRSDVRVARFDPNGPDGPRLVDEHVVRPGNGHWCETQWWAPDGSGFLYTETVDFAINPELFFCRLPDPARGECRPVRLTDDPAWDEQAIFTPDMSRVLVMSSRDVPGGHNNCAKVASFLELPADYDYALILQVFVDSYLQPVFQQPTDLYEIKLRWNAARTRFKPGAVRRLTTTGNDGWVIPEFAFDPSGRRLLWTQNKFADGTRIDQSCIVRQIRDGIVAQLSGITRLQQVPLFLDRQVRDQAVELLRDPMLLSLGGRGCGGSETPSYAQETVIAHYED